MPTNIDKLNENIVKAQERVEQLKRQKRAHEKREQAKTRKEDTRRKIVIGGIVLKYFPEFEALQPQHNNADNNIEFAQLANFLSALVADKDLVARLKAEAQAKTEAQNQQ